MIQLGFASLIWACSFGLIKTYLVDLNPYLVSLLRLAVSAIAFAPFTRLVPTRQCLRLISIGALQFGLMYSLYIASFRYLKAHEVALLTITTPLFVVIFDGLIHKRLRANYWWSAMLAILAVYLLVAGSGRWSQSWPGILMLQAANACFALGQLLYKRWVPGRHAGQFTWMYLGALIVPALFLIGFGDTGQGLTDISAQQMGVLLYLGLVASGIAFFLWNLGVTKVNNGMVASMNNAKIPLATLVSWWFFGESPDLPRLSLCFVLFGFALFLVRDPSDKKPK